MKAVLALGRRALAGAMSPRLAAAALGLLLACCSSLLAQSTQAEEEWTIETQRDARSIAGVAELQVSNLHGDVRIRAGMLAELELSAVIQRRADASESPRISFTEEGDRLRVEVLGPSAPSGALRVDLTLLVPLGPALSVITDRGLIEAKGLEGPLEARSERGNLTLHTAGPVRAQSAHGRIALVITAPEWPGVGETAQRRGRRESDEAAGSLRTRTGDIEVWFPWRAALRIEAETHGVVRTDVSVEVEQAAPNAAKRVTATVRPPGVRRHELAGLRLVSEKGTISLFRSANS